MLAVANLQGFSQHRGAFLLRFECECFLPIQLDSIPNAIAFAVHLSLRLQFLDSLAIRFRQSGDVSRD